MTRLSLNRKKRHAREDQSLAGGKRRRRIQEALTGYLFILPAGIATFVFGLWPVISGFYESLKSGSPLTNRYVGLNNYVRSLGNLAYVLLFTLSVIFIYAGYRAWRDASRHRQEYGGNLWYYLPSGFVFSIGLIILAFQFVTGTKAYDWLPGVMIALAVAGFCTADHLQTRRSRQRWRQLGAAWLAFLGIAVLWWLLAAVEPRAISTQFLVWMLLITTPTGIGYLAFSRLESNREWLEDSHARLAELKAAWQAAPKQLAAIQRLSRVLIAYNVALSVGTVLVVLIPLMLGIPLLAGLVLLVLAGLIRWQGFENVYWPIYQQTVARLVPLPSDEREIDAARSLRRTVDRILRRRITVAVLALLTLAAVIALIAVLFAVVGTPAWLLLLGTLGLMLFVGPSVARIRTAKYVGTSISVGLMILIAFLLTRYAVAQMEANVNRARDMAQLIFNEDVLDATVDATDSELETVTRIQGLSFQDEVTVEVEVGDRTIQAPLAPEVYSKIPASKISQLVAGFSFQEKVKVVLPDGSVAEGTLTEGQQVAFTADDPEAVRAIDLYSALNVGSEVIRVDGHTEPLRKQIYGALVIFLGIGTIYLMTRVRREVDEDYEPDAVRHMFRLIAAGISLLLVLAIIASGPLLGVLLDRAAGVLPLFTLLFSAATVAALVGVVRWVMELDDERRQTLAERVVQLDKGLQALYLGAALVLVALVIGTALDLLLGLFPFFALALGLAMLLGLYKAIPWLLDQHPSVHKWLYWGRVLMALVVGLTFFYMIGSVQLSQQAAAGFGALTEDQFDRAYEFATGEAPPINLYAKDLAAELRYWPQIFMIACGALLIGIAYLVWQSAQKRETPLGFGLTILLAIMMMVGGWLTISELPRALSIGGREAEETMNALTRTAMYSMGTVPVQLTFGLFLAYLLFSEISWGKSLYRVIYFIPYIAPSVATSTVFLVIFKPSQKSLANQAMGLLGIDMLTWLKDPNGVVRIFYEQVLGGNPLNIPAGLQGPSLALTTVILYNIWVFSGYNAVVFLAGLGAIPSELYEAAEVDGAGRWSRFRNITLPLLSPTTFFLSMLSIIGTFKAFSHIYVLRGQATGKEIDTMSVHIFNSLYSANDPGYAAALAFTLFGVILILTVVQNRLAREQVFYG
jgi:ABC-type sugar transport system permease subunit